MLTQLGHGLSMESKVYWLSYCHCLSVESKVCWLSYCHGLSLESKVCWLSYCHGLPVESKVYWLSYCHCLSASTKVLSFACVNKSTVICLRQQKYIDSVTAIACMRHSLTQLLSGVVCDTKSIFNDCLTRSNVFNWLDFGHCASVSPQVYWLNFCPCMSFSSKGTHVYLYLLLEVSVALGIQRR